MSLAYFFEMHGLRPLAGFVPIPAPHERERQRKREVSGKTVEEQAKQKSALKYLDSFVTTGDVELSMRMDAFEPDFMFLI